MLDFNQILPHLELLADESVRRTQIKRDQISVALTLVNLSDEEWQPHLTYIRTQQTKWLAAKPAFDVSILNSIVDPPACPVPYSAIACDGSQIPLDRHEIAPCYLLSVGRIALHYGAADRPLMDSVSKLKYTDEDLMRSSDEVESQEQSFVTEDEIADRRFAFEMDSLAGLVELCRGRPDAVGLVDGTLILWSKESGAGKNKMLEAKVNQYLKAVDRAKNVEVPIAGYLSRPGSREVVGVLRICLKDGEVDRLVDADIFGAILKVGQRSGMFYSDSKVLSKYGADQTILFFYLNVGSEIVRIEIPQWVATDSFLVERVHAVAFDQARKGGGYPVCLTEAHEQAVIRASDREAFFRLVENAMMKKHLPALRTAKSVAKRRRTI